MKSTTLHVFIALLAAGASAPLLAGDDGHDRQRDRSRHERSVSRFDQGMQPVVNAASATDRAHGWRYFSDPSTHRAVVISPQGDYYLSHGKGLRWVAGTPVVG